MWTLNYTCLTEIKKLRCVYYMPAISEVGRTRQEEEEFEASLDYMTRPWRGDSFESLFGQVWWSHSFNCNISGVEAGGSGVPSQSRFQEKIKQTNEKKDRERDF